jgi:hypothetical protein
VTYAWSARRDATHPRGGVQDRRGGGGGSAQEGQAGAAVGGHILVGSVVLALGRGEPPPLGARGAIGDDQRPGSDHLTKHVICSYRPALLVLDT